MAFNRDRNNRSGGDRGGFRPRFNDRGASRGPVEMHQAVCDNCGKSCEVPFRPTSGRPVFCSNCFEGNRSSDSKSANYEEKRMFEAVCDECGNSCKVPFQPSGDKPVYCSNCFGEKKGAGNKEKEQFEQLNNKLDKILILLEGQTVNTEKKTKIAKKKPSKVVEGLGLLQ